MMEVTVKQYRKRAPGEYAGVIGGERGRITVPKSGTFETQDPAVMDFCERVLGWEGIVKGLERKSPVRARAVPASEKE